MKKLILTFSIISIAAATLADNSAVMTDNTGAIVAPTNFWEANAADLHQEEGDPAWNSGTSSIWSAISDKVPISDWNNTNAALHERIDKAQSMANMGGDVSGPSSNATVRAIRNIVIENFSPGAGHDGYALKYNFESNFFELGQVATEGSTISNIVIISGTAQKTDVAVTNVGIYRTVRPGNLPSCVLNAGGYEVAFFDLLGITLQAGTLHLLGSELEVNVAAYDGSATAPAYTWAGDKDLGKYRFSYNGDYAEGYACLSNLVWYWASDGLHLTNGASIYGMDYDNLSNKPDLSQYSTTGTVAGIDERLTTLEAWPTSSWDTAYGWGDHSAAGYATGTPVYAESDPVFADWKTTNSLDVFYQVWVSKEGNDANDGKSREKPKLTISDAITDYGSGLTTNWLVINIGPGLYDETVTLDNNIWLKGSGQGTVIYRASSDGILCGANDTNIITDLRVSLADAGTGERALEGTTGGSLDVRNCTFEITAKSTEANGKVIYLGACSFRLQDCDILMTDLIARSGSAHTRYWVEFIAPPVGSMNIIQGCRFGGVPKDTTDLYSFIRSTSPQGTVLISDNSCYLKPNVFATGNTMKFIDMPASVGVPTRGSIVLDGNSVIFDGSLGTGGDVYFAELGETGNYILSGNFFDAKSGWDSSYGLKVNGTSTGYPIITGDSTFLNVSTNVWGLNESYSFFSHNTNSVKYTSDTGGFGFTNGTFYVDGGFNVPATIPQSSTDNTPTLFTPRTIGDELIIHTTTNVLYRAFGTTSNDWRSVYP